MSPGDTTALRQRCRHRPKRPCQRRGVKGPYLQYVFWVYTAQRMTEKTRMDEKRVTRRAERQERVNEREAQRYVAGHWSWVSELRGGKGVKIVYLRWVADAFERPLPLRAQ